MFAGLALGWIAGVAGVALAQDGFDAHGFRLAALEADVRDPLTLQRPDGLPQQSWFAGGLLEFANQSLVYRTTTPDGQEVSSESALDDLFALNTSFGAAPHDRVRVDVAMPLYFTSRGLDGGQGVGIGDTRISVRALAVAPEDTDGFGFGVTPYLDLPFGQRAKFLGQGAAGGGLDAAGTAEVEGFTATGTLGVYFGPTRELDGLVVGDAITTGLAFGYAPLDDLGFTAETHLGLPLRRSDVRGVGTPSEILLSGRKTTASGGHGLAGFAFATTKGASAAEWRLFVGGGFGQGGESTPKDTDVDGIVDRDDACREEPETFNGLDDQDGCPDALPKLRVTVTRDGAPVQGAELSVQPAGGTAVPVTSGSKPYVTDAFPDSTWRATAKLGCLSGVGQLTTPLTGDSQLEVRLAVAYDAELKVLVVGTDGASIPDATVTLSAADAACTARSPEGRAGSTFDVPAGAQKVAVTAPGYGTVRQEITIASGESKEVRIQLAPSRVQLTDNQIVILETVQFETGKAVLLPASFSLLDAVAEVMLDNPQLDRIEVAGHTDNVGTDAANLALSQKRADAVRAYLIGDGVEAARLVAKGYGETKPIDTNATTNGKAKNRRVEFNILK